MTEKFLTRLHISHRSLTFLASLIIFLVCHPPRIAQAQTSALENDGYLGAAEPATVAEVYGQGVRETEWRSPSDEQLGFHLPPGFSTQLYASEPQINKPLNMAWDTRGRLWISNTLEYPYPAAPDAVPRDSIKILEDTTGDGQADKITTFADQLNIPMGLLPVSDGVICFSIPFIWHLRDTDGDNKVDERIKLLGPFDTTRDTHGMINALRRGDDGWIYACHGFNNQSTVTAKDGSSVRLISGNTFRFKDDGSRIEQFTSGQVNPFGMTQDEYGNWYTADCHSKPLTALLRGACYPSFGRPHDGLGFAPSMMEHLHSSTAISGLNYYLGEVFPTGYRKLFYSGNVMTSRINCNRLVWQGATPIAQELPDFLTSDDPWFRPVDIQLGFDGALYVADFYNKIIGHYEVPLTHPGRDRDSGRIWRITYAEQTAGQSEQTGMQKLVNPTQRRADIESLIVSPGTTQANLTAKLFPSPRTLSDLKFVQVLDRRHELTDSVVKQLAGANLTDRQLCTLLSMASSWSAERRQSLLPLARRHVLGRSSNEINFDAHLARNAVEFLGLAGGVEDVERLLTVVDANSGKDPLLTQAARIAVRNLIVPKDNLQFAIRELLDSPSGRLPESFVRILPGVNTPVATLQLARQVSQFYRDDQDLVELTLNQLVNHLGSGQIPSTQVVECLEQLSGDDFARVAERLGRVANGYRSQTGKIPTEIREYGSQFIHRSLIARIQDKLGDQASLAWIEDNHQVWKYQTRNLAGSDSGRLLSSHTIGEAYTGSLRSESFSCPREIRFWLAGHNRPPYEDDEQRNVARLVDSLTRQTLQQAYVPRNDTAQEVVWDTSASEGRQCYMELVDGDKNESYAWIAAGQFSIAALNSADAVPEFESLETVLRSGAFVDGRETYSALEKLRLGKLNLVRLAAQVAHGQGEMLVESLILQAISLGRLDLIDASLPIVNRTDEKLTELANELCASATQAQQHQFAKELMSSVQGFELVATLLSQGKLSASSLENINILLPDALSDEARTQITRAMEQAPAVNQETQQAGVANRLSQLTWPTASTSLGKQLYDQHCAACHQLRGAGKVVGPQLDGAVARGAQRLGEDILNPNQNVDLAFRQSTLLLDNDTIVTGLITDQPDGSLILTAQDGKQTTLSASQVLQRKQTAQSLMPSNFGELLDDHKLTSLLRYLIEGGTAPPVYEPTFD